MNQSVPVFRGQYLGADDIITSGPVQALGNKVVLQVVVINATTAAAPSGLFYIDGTYDGVVWTELATVTKAAFGAASVAETALDVAQVRVRAKNTVASSAILFDATLAFSDQG